MLGRRSIAFALEAFAQHLAVAADRLCFFANPAFRRLFVSPAPFHVAEGALALHFLLEYPQCGIEVVVAHEDLHSGRPFCCRAHPRAKSEKGEPRGAGSPSRRWAEPARPVAG